MTKAMMVFPYADGPQGCGFEVMTSLWTGGGPNGFGHAELWVLESGEWHRLTATTDAGVIDSPEDQFADPLFPDPRAYQMVNLPDDFDVDKVLAVLAPELGAPYDWGGVTAYVFGFVTQDPNKWYCSELCAELLATDARFAGLKQKQFQYSPNALFKEVTRILASAAPSASA